MHSFQIVELANSIRIAHKQVLGTKIAHCGFTLDIGSRDEEAHEQGIAHFWEHMAFKGTVKRKANAIINRLENVGGELNAFTSKEKICFHASVLDIHFEKALDLLSDITFFSVFPKKEIEKERGVILEEMSMYEDDPSEHIFDDYEELVYPNHPLGRNIIGTKESVSSFKHEDFLKFLDKHLDCSKVVFTSVSALSFAKVKALCEKYLANIPARSAKKTREPFSHFAKGHVKRHRNGIQAHYLMGSEACSLYHKDRLGLFLLTNLLGGPSMNARLNMQLREKNGLVYAIEANHAAFTDTGIFSIYFAAEEKVLPKCIDLVQKELQKIQSKALSTMQLHKAKTQLMGQLAMAEESNNNLMLFMGRVLLDTSLIENLSDVFKEIDRISAKQLQEMAIQYFKDCPSNSLTYLPIKD